MSDDLPDRPDRIEAKLNDARQKDLTPFGRAAEPDSPARAPVLGWTAKWGQRS